MRSDRRGPGAMGGGPGRCLVALVLAGVLAAASAPASAAPLNDRSSWPVGVGFLLGNADITSNTGFDSGWVAGVTPQFRVGYMAVVLAAVHPAPAKAEEPAQKPSRFQKMIDPEDGKFDMSAYLASARGFLPSPIIITEPAVGYGGGLNLLFLHDSIENRAEKVRERAPDGKAVRLPPPSISGVAGAGTENGTWGTGLFHFGVFRDDRIRYLGLGGYGSVNYDFYPPGELDLPLDEIPVNVESAFMKQQVLFRVGGSDFMAGLAYRIQWATAKPDVNVELPAPAEDGVEIRAGGATPILEYDTRDNIFTPNHGLNNRIEWTFYEKWLGGDDQFQILEWRNRVWFQLSRSFVLGLRLDGQFSNGSVPFYMLPSVQMRGIQAKQYVGDQAVSAEAELRWDFTRRWSLVGFGGDGWTSTSGLSGLSNHDTSPAGGFGFRYLVARVFQIRMGLDLGFSEDTTAVYVTTGSAW